MGFLEARKSSKIDLKTLIAVLTFQKEVELMGEQESDSDEYLDAFVALGGGLDKEGEISKNMLIEIIKI